MLFSLETIKVRRVVLIKLGVLLLFIGVLFSFTDEASNEISIPNLGVPKKELSLNAKEGRWYVGKEPFNGFAVVYYQNCLPKEKVGYYDGKREGLAHQWHENGVLASEKFFIANRAEGAAKTWWPNGALSSLANYSNRMRHGKQKSWYPNGELAKITNYNQGKEEGLQQAWLPNGKRYVNYEAKNGRFFGLRRANLCYQLKDEVVQY